MSNPLLILKGWLVIILAIIVPVCIGIVVGVNVLKNKGGKTSPLYNPPQYYSNPTVTDEYTPKTTPPGNPMDRELASFLSSWESAWESQNIDYFMGFYDKGFQSRGLDYYQLEEYQKDIFYKFQDIKLSWDEANYQQISGGRIRLNFRQKLVLDDQSDTGTVTMEVIKDKGRWQIISETWNPY